MLKLKRFSEAQWFPYEKIPGVRFKIRAVTPADILDIKAKVKKKVAVLNPAWSEEVERKQLEDKDLNPLRMVERYITVDDVDDGQMSKEMFRFALVDWDGISTEPDDMTREEVLKGLFNDVEVRAFVQQKSIALFKSEDKKLEGELKNSDSSQAG